MVFVSVLYTTRICWVFTSAFSFSFSFLGALPKKRKPGEFSSPGFTCKGLDSSLFQVRIIASIRYNHMVSKMDAHDFCGLLHTLGQHVIVLAGMKAS